MSATRREIGSRLVLVVAGALTVAFSQACAGHHHVDAGGGPTGAATARGAVTAFLSAARATDLQAMSIIWGTNRGPARDQINQDILEKRETIMVCFLNVEKSNIDRESTSANGSRVFDVTLTRGSLSKQTTFLTVEGPASRWYVQEVDLLKVKDFCKNEQSDSLHYQTVSPQDVPKNSN